MKNIFILFLFIFLSACTVYTVTNKTSKELKIERAGGEQLTLKALKCFELNEYFLGLGGDFPFIIKGENVEHGAGNYEVKPDNEKTLGYTTELSEKNTDCNPEEDSEGPEKDNNAPVCNDGKKATCYASTAKCVVKEEGENKKSACVDENGENLESVKPDCEDKSEPTCPTKGRFVMDQERQAFCAKGSASCSEGEAKCVKENEISTPFCLKEGKKVENVEVKCPDADSAPKCLKSVEVTVKEGFSASCTDKTPFCAEGSKAVCGSVSTDNTEAKPYCVNDDNIRWSDDVTCVDGNQPTCTGS